MCRYSPDPAGNPAATAQGGFAAEPGCERHGRSSRRPASGPLSLAGHAAHGVTEGHCGRTRKSCGDRARSVMVFCRSGDLFLDDLAYDDFFSVASQLGQPVFLHPQLPSAAIRDASYRGFDPMTDLALATYGWGWHMDAATVALRLILRGTFDRHPELQIVLGHWGEMLLFWLDRATVIPAPPVCSAR